MPNELCAQFVHSDGGVPIRRRPFVLISCLVLVLGALGISYLLTFHLESLQRMVREQFAHAFGPSVQIGQIHASFFPPQLELIDVYLKEDGFPDPFFHVSRLRLDLTLFSFLQDRMESEGLLMEQPSLHILRDITGRWNIPQAWISRKKGDSVIGAWLSPFKVNVVDGEIMIIDVFEQDQPQSLLVKNLQLQMANRLPQSEVDFSMSARLADKHSESPVAVYGRIDDFSKLIAWFQGTGSVLPSVALHGRGTLAQSEMAQLARLFNREYLPLEIHGDLEVQGKMRMGPGDKGYQMVFSEMAVRTDVLSLKGDASISGLFDSDPPTLSVNWSGAPIDLSTLVTLVPGDFLPPAFIEAVTGKIIGGKVEVLSATLSGSLREEVGLSMNGEVHLTDGFLNLGQKWGMANRIEGTLKIEPDQVRLLGFHGFYDSIPVTDGTGVIEFRESGPWLMSELEGEVPVVNLLNILQEVFDWHTPHTMSTLRGLKGSGPMKIHFAGPLEHPELIRFQEALYFPQGVSLFVPGLTKPLTGVSGTLSFSTTQVKFNQIRAKWRKSELGVHGAIEFQDRKYFDDIQIQGKLHGADVFDWIKPEKPTKEWFIQGPMLVDGMLSGALTKPRVTLSMDLEGAKIAIPGMLGKAAGVGGTLAIEFFVKNGAAVTLERVGLSLPSLHASGKGDFPFASREQFSAFLVVEPVTVAKLPVGVTVLDGMLNSGTVEISLNVDGRGADWRQWNKNGWVAVTDGRLNVAGMPAAVTDALVRLKFHDHEMEVKRLELRMVNSHARIEGIIHGWDTEPVAVLSGVGEHFDLDLLIPKGSRSPIREFLEYAAANMRVRGQLTFDQAFYKTLRFPQLSGNIRMQDGVIGIEQLIGKMEQGELNGRFLIHLPIGAAASMKTWINLKTTPLEVLEQTFLSGDALQERMWTGLLSLEGMLEGDGKNPDGIMSSLQGSVKCMIRDGRIKRGTIVPKMLALMNLPTLLQGKVDLSKDGYPFDSQSATVEVKNGVFTSNDIVMTGPILKMSAAGSYDGVQDSLNLVAAASPFGPYFDLLRKVSLFRMLLKGEEKGLEMALFEVKGSLHNPDVQALPLESFTAGLTGIAKLAFSVLKNTVMLPGQIFFPDKKDAGAVPDSPNNPGVPNHPAMNGQK